MSEQEVFELGQLYAELYLIRKIINEGQGVRQRLLTQSACDRIQGIGDVANATIGDILRRIDDHKAKRGPQ